MLSNLKVPNTNIYQNYYFYKNINNLTICKLFARLVGFLKENMFSCVKSRAEMGTRFPTKIAIDKQILKYRYRLTKLCVRGWHS